MGTLDAKRLIALIESGRRYGPLGVDDTVPDQLIAKVREEKHIFSSESPTVIKLRKFISEPLTAIKSERKALFDIYDLFVLPEDICLCIAEAGSSTHPPSVVISTGMINLIGSSPFIAHIDALIQEDLSAFYSLRYPQVPVANLFVTILFLFRYRYFRYAEPMPDFFSVLPEEKLQDILLMIGGVVTTMLLHEFGHHELGHLESEIARSMAYNMIVAQSLSDYQRQEAEADQFALQSVITEAFPLITYWLQQNLDFFIQLELMTGIRDKHHPLAINRAFNAGILRQGELNKYGLEPENQREKAERLATKFLQKEITTAHVESQSLQIKRETCFEILEDVAAIVAPLGVDLAPLLNRDTHFDCLQRYEANQAQDRS